MSLFTTLVDNFIQFRAIYGTPKSFHDMLMNHNFQVLTLDAVPKWNVKFLFIPSYQNNHCATQISVVKSD